MHYDKDTILQNIKEINERVTSAARHCGRDPADVKIVAATKTVPAEYINFAYENGITRIGENRVQELLEKYERLKKEIEIHFIGTLQTNKVKYIIDKVEMIHSVDSEKLAREIDKQAKKHGKVMKVLIEVNIGDEASKSGVAPQDIVPLLEKIAPLTGISVRGLMAIPPACHVKNLSETQQAIVGEINGTAVNNSVTNIAKDATFEYFQKIKQILIDISVKKIDNITTQELSLGMSGDFEDAIKVGSTMIRPGRILFGERKP